jgi:hypothetical protein
VKGGSALACFLCWVRLAAFFEERLERASAWRRGAWAFEAEAQDEVEAAWAPVRLPLPAQAAALR